MAWQDGNDTHQHRKLAASSLRAARRRAAITAAVSDELTKLKKKSRPKPYGLEFFYKSMFTHPPGQLSSFKQWYETAKSREIARAHGLGQTLCGKPRYHKIDKVER